MENILKKLFIKFIFFIFSISNATVLFANCSPNSAVNCTNQTLCKFATTIRKDKIVWVMEKDYYFQAKRRNLSCDVGKSTKNSNGFKPSGSYVKYNEGKLVNYFCGVEFFKKPSKFEIQSIQRELISKNLFIGEIDGKHNDATCNAFKKYTNEFLKLIDNKYTKKQHNLLMRSRMISMLNTNMGNENVFKTLVTSFDAPCKKNKKYIISLQKKLKELGYYKSAVDGIYGPGTAKAYKGFENKLGPEIGKLDGCLSNDEYKWLDLHIKAHRLGFSCAKPKFSNEAFEMTSNWFSDIGFFKLNGFSKPETILSPTGKYIFASSIISFEASIYAERLRLDLSKNCNLDNSETSQLLTVINHNVDDLFAKEFLIDINPVKDLKLLNTEKAEIDINDDKVSEVNQTNNKLNKSVATAQKEALVRELEVAKVEDPVVAAPIECSIESIETCTTEQICENAIEVIYGISSYKRGEDKFVESVKKDEIKCNYPNVLDDIPPKLLVEYLERFIEENGNIFDLDLIIKLQSLRDLFDLEKPAKNTQAHIEFVGYLKPYSEFENFAVDLERIYKSKKQEELALMTNQLADKVKSLKEWAQNNIMDPKAIEVVNFIKLFEENDKLSIDKASELTLMVAKLNELIYESKPQLEETKNTEDVLEDSAVENQNSSKELLSFPTISSFEIIQFTKEFGDGFDNFSAPKNFALALIKVKLDNIVSGEEFDAENIILLSSSGQTYEVNLSAIQAWAAQMGEAIPVSTKKLYVSDGFVDLVFMVKLSDKSNAEFKLSGAEVPSK